MGAGFEQRPWTPTVRRGPIAAELKSPASNSVELPPLLGKQFSLLSYKLSSPKKSLLPNIQHMLHVGVVK